MEYICRKCKKSIEDVAEAMITGCLCGSRTFQQIGKNTSSNTKDNSPQDIEELVELTPIESKTEFTDDVAIIIKDKGQYAVNLNALIERTSGLDPLFVQDKKGVINVLFNPDP